MKRITICFLMILAARMSVFADEKDDIMGMLMKIESANADVETLQGRFAHERINKDSLHEVYEGMLYVNNDNMAMHYDKADMELFMIEGDKIHMRRKGKIRDINLKVIKPMRSLKTTLLYSMQGKVASLASSQPSYNVKIIEDSREIIVEFRSAKKGLMGYDMIRNTYNAANFLLKRMEMVEFNGNSNIYTVDSASANKYIDPKMFDIELY